MTTAVSAIILAGGLRPSPLRESLGVPILCLPIAPRRSLLAAWLEQLRDELGCRRVHIVVSDEQDAVTLRRHLQNVEVPAGVPEAVVMVEPARWRGTGGLLKDAAAHLGLPERILLVEAGCLVPDALAPLLDEITAGEHIAVGVDAECRPAGVYAFRGSAVREIPSEGYLDLKEQVLPAFHEQGIGGRAVTIARRAHRLRDRLGYLSVVRSMSRPEEPGAALATVSADAVVSGSVLLGRDVIVEAGAVVHDSVVLDGVVIRQGAVVSRSIVGSGREIAAGRVVRDVVEAAQSDTGTGGLRTRRPWIGSKSGRQACSPGAS